VGIHVFCLVIQVGKLENVFWLGIQLDSWGFMSFGWGSSWIVGDSCLLVGDPSWLIGDAQNFNQLVETFSFDLFGMHG
jgi:hypothetical protein